jgi:hypothetical protein
MHFFCHVLSSAGGAHRLDVEPNLPDPFSDELPYICHLSYILS